MHIVHYNSKYGNFNDALTQADGLAVLGVLIEVCIVLLIKHLSFVVCLFLGKMLCLKCTYKVTSTKEREGELTQLFWSLGFYSPRLIFALILIPENVIRCTPTFLKNT
jgi:hypothetical protein